MGSHILAIQEADIPEYRINTIRTTITNAHKHCDLPATTDMSTEHDKRRGKRIATITTTNPMRSSIQDDNYKFLIASGRWIETIAPTDTKGKFVFVANFYGISKASGDTKVYRDNERLIAAAILRLNSSQTRRTTSSATSTSTARHPIP